jgi:WD40 repeat protein
VCWGKEEHHLVSASYDQTVKFWDVRAAVPLYTIAAHDAKALCVTVGPRGEIVSGGADGKVKRFVDPATAKAAAASA